MKYLSNRKIFRMSFLILFINFVVVLSSSNSEDTTVTSRCRTIAIWRSCLDDIDTCSLARRARKHYNEYGSVDNFNLLNYAIHNALKRTFVPVERVVASRTLTTMYSKTLVVFTVLCFFWGSAHGQKENKFFREDYTYLEKVRSFYKIHTTPQTWADAKRVCALEGATFWHPDNEDEANAVLTFWNTTQSGIGWVYVGLSDTMSKGLFETTEGKLVSEVYHNWQPGQPNNYGGKEDCVYIYKSGIMDDWGCDSSYMFICKKSLQSLEWNHQCNMPYTDYTLNEGTGKCYKLHTTPMSWNDAYAACRLEQSHLAIIGNRFEAEYLANFTESTPKPRVKGNYHRGMYHVGFHNKYNEGWQTVKGTPMNVDADTWFDNYQPDESDQCGAMFFNGRLVNIDCESKSFFICEHESSNLEVDKE